jgi:segregation and condensation protein A
METSAPGDVKKSVKKVSQEQIHGLLFGEKLSWQAIIYDLINTEQLDPWDIDITILSNKYLEKIRELEEHNFFVSSKVLLAAALLLRIKSEILIDKDLENLDAALYGRKEEKRYVQERIELDEDVPELIPRTPLPRFKRVTLQELMSALGKAINTENRRIKRVVIDRQREIETAIALPRKTINIQEQIRKVHSKLKDVFKNREEKLAFSEFAGESKDEKISHFVPLLHLDSQKEVWLEQEGHLKEIWIWLRSLYEKKVPQFIEKLKEGEDLTDEDFEEEGIEVEETGAVDS